MGRRSANTSLCALVCLSLARARDKKISEHNDVFADRRPPLYRAVSG